MCSKKKIFRLVENNELSLNVDFAPKSTKVADLEQVTRRRKFNSRERKFPCDIILEKRCPQAAELNCDMCKGVY